jgi:hypothetical protein
MKILCITVGVAISLGVAGSPGHAQESARDAARLARLAQTLDAETYRSVAQVIEGARARALPIDPLVDRALEGAMKRAPASRIRTAVATLAQRLELARTALAPSPTEADITAGAGALAVGVPGETLRAIRSIQPNEPVAVPLGVLTELVARSVPIDRAATLVVQLLRRGATSTQLVALSGDVQRDIAAGIDPSAAFDVRTRGVASALGGSEATARTLDGASAPAPGQGVPTTTSGGPPNSPRAPAPRGGTRRP